MHMFSSKTVGAIAEKYSFLNCRRLPDRINTSEAAALLGVQEHDIAPLIAARLLVPLGKPAPNAPKYFSSVEIVQLTENCSWLSEATKALAKHWLVKNTRKRINGADGPRSA